MRPCEVPSHVSSVVESCWPNAEETLQDMHFLKTRGARSMSEMHVYFSAENHLRQVDGFSQLSRSLSGRGMFDIDSARVLLVWDSPKSLAACGLHRVLLSRTFGTSLMFWVYTNT